MHPSAHHNSVLFTPQGIYIFLTSAQKHGDDGAFFATEACRELTAAFTEVAGRGAVGAREHLTYERFLEMMEGFRVSEEEARQLMMGVDVSRDGVVGVSEWRAAMADWEGIQEHPQVKKCRIPIGHLAGQGLLRVLSIWLDKDFGESCLSGCTTGSSY